MNPDLKNQLLGVSTKKRSSKGNCLLTRELREAAEQLRSNNDIVIRKADKANIFVILYKTDYFAKFNSLLNDVSKFQRITRDPNEELQKKTNKLINKANIESDSSILTPIKAN